MAIPHAQPEPQKKRKNYRLLFLLLFFFVLIFVILFLRSPWSKIDTIRIVGNELLTDEEILSYAKLHPGINFFELRTGEVIRLLEELDEVKEVQIKKSFPGKLLLQITEYERVALWKEDGKLYPLLGNGVILKSIDWTSRYVDRPLITTWSDTTLLPELGIKLDRLDEAILQSMSEVILVPTEKEPDRIHIYMRDGNETVTSLRYLEKMQRYLEITSVMGTEKGVIYLLEAAWFQPYDLLNENKDLDSSGE
ncbi:cell division protein FtsQ/DivIB [Rubeoparvulum massiliense]|uniref:cell division protein FtsQ/DivIB n=1 Tax=Rubeoparvulum massiliense TaxID=1631346 RepID=UPI00065E1920|nr:FtsQ-type POTRA domain-containing protein [Rubeoparvulum massiliense]